MPELKKRSYEKIFAKLFNTPWLIEQDWMASIIEIARRENDIDAVKTHFSKRLESTRTAYVRNYKSHIPISGPIFPRANMMTEYCGATSISTLAKDFQVALDDDNVEEIILDIDSPGGAVTGVNEMANIIKAARSQKKITAYVSGTGASAAYWLASAASEIVLDATARVGSIGVVAAYPISDDSSRVEIVNTASPKKRFDPNTKEGKEIVIDELDALADVFISTVAENRNVSEKVVRTKFGLGGILVGQNAVDVGMADRLGSFEQLLIEESDNGGEEMPKADSNQPVVTADSLKKSNPDVYDSIFEAGASAAVEESEGIVKDKDKQIAILEENLKASQESNDALNARIGALEKNELIRSEKDLEASANSIVSGKLSASAIPTRLHEKVSAMIDHSAFVVDGKLDTEAFAASVDSEISDWEQGLEATSPVQGFSVPAKDIDAEETEADDTVARMMKNAGIS